MDLCHLHKTCKNKQLVVDGLKIVEKIVSYTKQTDL